MPHPALVAAQSANRQRRRQIEEQAARKAAQRQRLSAVVRSLMLLLVLPAGVFTAVLLYGRYEHLRTAAPPPGQPGALVWDDGNVIFANTNEIAAWVKQHGGAFKAFQKNHPAALDLVRATPPKVSSTQKLAAGKKEAAVPKKKAADSDAVAVAAPATPVASVDSRFQFGAVLLGVLAVLLFLAAVAPQAVVVRVPVLRESSSDMRMATAAAAIAIAAGLAVVMLL